MQDLTKIASNSANRYEYVALKTSKSFSVAAGGFTTVVFTHNLGYIPYYKGWYDYNTTKTYQLFAGVSSFDIEGNSVQIDTINETTTTISIDIVSSAVGTVTGNIYMRIYAEPQV